MAYAAHERLLHRDTDINVKGDSYRMHEQRQAGLFPGAVTLEPATKEAPPRGGQISGPYQPRVGQFWTGESGSNLRGR